jgi:penicillin-binding protein-related factor A (putative recombinase)
MSEASFSLAFITLMRKTYGRDIWIEKVIRPDKKAEPDIQGVFKGMPFFFECKLLNSKSFTTLHEFSDLQIDVLKTRSLSGAVCLGLLFCDKEVKYLKAEELVNRVTKKEWENAYMFNILGIYLDWKKKICQM